MFVYNMGVEGLFVWKYAITNF